MIKLKTTDEVIEALGGRKAIAELTGRDPHSVLNWETKRRNRFPRETLFVMQDALGKLEKPATAPLSLWGFETTQDKRSRRSLRVDGNTDPSNAGRAA